jgi:hypothetical protein
MKENHNLTKETNISIYIWSPTHTHQGIDRKFSIPLQ